MVFYQPWIGPLLAATPGTATGGAETHVLLLARGLARRGRRVAVITWPVDGSLPEELDGVRIVAIPRLRRVFPITRVVRVLWVIRALLRVDARVYVQKNAEFDTGLVGLVTRLRRRRFAWAASNISDFDYGRVERSRTNRIMFRLGVALAHRRIVQTEEQRHLCDRRFGACLVIPNPAEPAPPANAEPRAFLWAARMADYKHPELYVELARRVPEASFWMVAVPTNDGERERLAAVERDAAGLANLELLPPRPRRELLRLMTFAVATVNTADFEGTSNVALEGFARGVPALVLTHDPDGIVEREGLGAHAHGSFERLVEVTRETWSRRAELSRTRARCRAYVERAHGLDAVLDQWEDALECAA